MKSLRLVAIALAGIAVVTAVIVFVGRSPAPIPDDQKSSAAPTDQAPKEENVIVTQHKIIGEAVEPPRTDAVSAPADVSVTVTSSINASTIAALREALKQDPNNPRTMLELARELHSKGDYRGAKAFMRRAMRLDPTLRQSPEIRKMIRDVRVNARRHGAPSRATR